MTRIRAILAVIVGSLALGLLAATPDSFAAYQGPGTFTTATGAASTQTARTHLGTIEAAYTLLMDQFYAAPDPAVLLGAAWTGVTGYLTSNNHGGDAPSAPGLSSDRREAWASFAAAYLALDARLSGEPPWLEIAFAAIEEMTVSVREAHTYFLPPEAYQEFLKAGSGEEESTGVGVSFLSSRAPFVITEVALDGPADRAGVRPGDTVVAINGHDVRRAPFDELSDLLEAPEGTALEFGLDRPGQGQITTAVTVGRYRFPDMETRIIGSTGYIHLREFTSFLLLPSGRVNVVQEMDATLERFEAAGVTSWVIDLRDNPGGYVFTSNALIGRFLPDAVTLQVSNQRGSRGQSIAAGRPFRTQRPMAVLINGGSGSASEVFAVTMQEHERAVIVGERSAGALAEGIPFPLPDGAGLNVAVAEARSGLRGAPVDEVGVTPDVRVAGRRTASDYAAGRDPQLAAALEALRDRGPLPAPPTPFTGQLSESALQATLTPYLPIAEQLPVIASITEPRALGDIVISYPTEFVNLTGTVDDGARLARTVQARGWQGGHARLYGKGPGISTPYVAVGIDLYSNISGAIDALNTNDAPLTLRAAPVPVQLGDGAVAYAGMWVNSGAVALVWRAGRAVVTVSYATIPGQESFEPVVALARVVDARLQRMPIPVDAAVPSASSGKAAVVTP